MRIKPSIEANHELCPGCDDDREADPHPGGVKVNWFLAEDGFAGPCKQFDLLGVKVDRGGHIRTASMESLSAISSTDSTEAPVRLPMGSAAFETGSKTADRTAESLCSMARAWTWPMRPAPRMAKMIDMTTRKLRSMVHWQCAYTIPDDVVKHSVLQTDGWLVIESSNVLYLSLLEHYKFRSISLQTSQLDTLFTVSGSVEINPHAAGYVEFFMGV